MRKEADDVPQQQLKRLDGASMGHPLVVHLSCDSSQDAIMDPIMRALMLSLVAVVTGGQLAAQTLTSLGPDAPTPGTNGISQFSTGGNAT